MLRADTFQQGVEFRAMVHVAKVAEFVEHHIILEVLRQAHQVQIQVDIAFYGAAAPVADIVFDANLIVVEAMLCGQFRQPPRKVGLGLLAQFGHLGRFLQFTPRVTPPDDYPHSAAQYISKGDFHYFDKDTKNGYLCAI